MNSVIQSKRYDEPVFCEKEILRYAGCKEADENILALLKACMEEAVGRFCYQVCYRLLPVTVRGEVCDFDIFRFHSQGLARNLKNCQKAILFAATVGVEIDRLIAKYTRLSPSKALMLGAIGAERVEALCNTFCKDMEKDLNTNLLSRFSPGYGDLPLDAQKEIFTFLDCGKRIGLTLNDSLLMSPSKSVTAIVGIKDEIK